MNTHVDFETSKMLKEKDFDEYCSHYYILDFQNFKSDNILYKTELPYGIENENIFQYSRRKNQPHLSNAPTIAQVIMWLYEKYDIWIHVCYIFDYKTWCWDCYKYKKENGLINEPFCSKIFEHKLPTEAYQEAIKYCLKEVI